MRCPSSRVLLLFAAASLFSCRRDPEPTTSSPPPASVRQPSPLEVIATTHVSSAFSSMPHARTSFTQGLAFWNGRLFEGTGMYGESAIVELDPKTGEELRRVADDAAVFGEGITVFHDQLFQLTWQEHVCVVFDPSTLRKIREMPSAEEGWGITHDDRELVTSDGSALLRFRDPETFHVTRQIAVTFEGHPVTDLNELEMVHGEIWANVWQTDFIVRISPSDGRVVGRLDLGGLLDPSLRSPDPDDVLNGIAFDERAPNGGRLLVTGKRWPRIFEIPAPALARTPAVATAATAASPR